MIDFKQIQDLKNNGDYLAIAGKLAANRAAMKPLGDLVASQELDEEVSFNICQRLQAMTTENDHLEAAMRDAAVIAFTEEVIK